VLCGNIKGLHDPYRNPTTQEGFARKWGQNPSMVTSFADGTKISFEQAIVANAKQVLGPDEKGVYRIDTADQVSAMISRFLLENDFEGFVKDITNYRR